MINETNLTKLAFVLAANGGGSGSGSSSGGGVLSIRIDGTVDPPRLDKTWQEIYDCVSGGALPVLMAVGKSNAQIAYIDWIQGRNIYFHMVADGQIHQITFTVDSPNDYPVMNTGDDDDDNDGPKD